MTVTGIDERTDEATLAFTLSRLDVSVKRHVLDVPVRTSFGMMTSRPAVFVRVEDRDGAIGFGEVWCNFPGCGAEHRASLIESEIAPRVVNRDFHTPDEAFAFLQESTRILTLQSGEFGPINQCISGLDIAVWDMLANRAGLPLYQFLGGSDPRIQVYASGINPIGVGQTAEQLLSSGHTRFKLKIGFGWEVDLPNLRALRDVVGPERQIMADANQAWDLAGAKQAVDKLEEIQLGWLEEPIPVDAQPMDWSLLKAEASMPIAAGENYIGADDFTQAISGEAVDVIQPDVCKWGGLSANRAIAADIRSANKSLCPHSLGAGVALAASAHFLAACGDGLLEVDGNPNPLREDTYPIIARNGELTLPNTPGLGVETDLLTSYFST